MIPSSNQRPSKSGLRGVERWAMTSIVARLHLNSVCTGAVPYSEITGFGPSKRLFPQPAKSDSLLMATICLKFNLPVTLWFDSDVEGLRTPHGPVMVQTEAISSLKSQTGSGYNCRNCK